MLLWLLDNIHPNTEFKHVLSLAKSRSSIDWPNTYLSLTLRHQTVLLKRRVCLLKRNVFACIFAVLSTSNSNLSPLSRTLSMFSIITLRTYKDINFQTWELFNDREMSTKALKIICKYNASIYRVESYQLQAVDWMQVQWFSDTKWQGKLYEKSRDHLMNKKEALKTIHCTCRLQSSRKQLSHIDIIQQLLPKG